MNRNRWLVLAVAFLLVANVVWHIYSRWGLITVHANPSPLSDVIRSIERQAGITLRTDLEVTTPVTMNVNRVPLSEALETLATVTDSNWRLTYVLAPNRADLANAVGTLTAGQKVEGWKTLYVPLRMMSGEGWTVPDPRRDRWEVKEPAEKRAQAYLEQGAKMSPRVLSFRRIGIRRSPPTFPPAPCARPCRGWPNSLAERSRKSFSS